MIPQHTGHSAKNRPAQLLVVRGCEPAGPVPCSELAPSVSLHFIGRKGDYEALCVKLRIARRPLSEQYVESLCRYDIFQFRSLLVQSAGNVFLRCQIRVVAPDNAIHCDEVLKTRIREVAVYAR